jgi:hypothetical protein
MARLRCERGQTASEYLGVFVLVAGLVAALAAGPVPGMISDAVEAAVCRIGGGCDSGGGPEGAIGGSGEVQVEEAGALERFAGGAVDFFEGAGRTAAAVATSEATHTVLDVAGLVPVIGEPADLLNAGIYEAQGDHVNAGLSAAGAIPFVGWGATGGKFALKYGDDAVSLVGGAAKHGDEVAGISKGIVKNADEAAALYRANLFPRSALRDPDFVTDVSGARRTAVTRNNAADVLSANMRRFNSGAPQPSGTTAHHMVPYGAGTSPNATSAARQAAAARRHLQRLGVDVNSAANGVFLPHGYHRVLHTKAYYREVSRRLITARSSDEAVQILDRVRRDLLEGKFPY